MTFTLIKPIERPEASRFVNVHRHYEQPSSGYESNQQQKRNDNKDKTKQASIKSVKKDHKTGDLIIKYQNGIIKKYSAKDSNYNAIEENLRSKNYSTNFDYKA